MVFHNISLKKKQVYRCIWISFAQDIVIMANTCIRNINIEVQNAIFVLKPNWLVILGMHATVDKIMASI